MTDFTAIDKLIDDEPHKAYEQLKQMLNKDNAAKSNVAVLWRMAKACFMAGNTFEKKDSRRKVLIQEGVVFARSAYSTDPNCFEALRWLAVLEGCSTDFMGVRERAEQGKVFKTLLDKALAINPKEFTLLHLRGRFTFEIATLSWLEKKVCNALFTQLPDASIDMALKDFAEAEQNVPFDWAENWLYMARCYALKKDKDNAQRLVNKVKALHNDTDMVRESIKEINDLIAKCK